jgi:hypothetical protein
LFLHHSLYPTLKKLTWLKAIATNNFFGEELPIIQAPMAGVQGSSLAIAVSSALWFFPSSLTYGQQYLMELHEKKILACHIIFSCSSIKYC